MGNTPPQLKLGVIHWGYRDQFFNKFAFYINGMVLQMYRNIPIYATPSAEKCHTLSHLSHTPTPCYFVIL